MANWKPKQSVRAPTAEDRAAERRDDLLRRMAESQRAHEAWLSSPEGQESQRQRAEREASAAKEKADKDAWAARSLEIQKNPPSAGSLLHSVKILCLGTEKKPSYWTRLLFVCNKYPNESYWRTDDCHGIICFLTKASVQQIRDRFKQDVPFSLIIKSVRVMGYSENRRSAQIQIVEW